ncbi:CarD family transcriptional regulator [Chloroflexota bacterium]
MEFSVGDKVVHPHRGPGRIIDVQRKKFLQEARRYYVLQVPAHNMTVHVPVRKADIQGIRPAMSRAKLARVLGILRSRPHQLPKDYKERQEGVWEKIRTARPMPTAEVVRDLTWRSRDAHLTKKDTELLKRGQDFLAAEMALVSDTEVSEAHERIEAALDTAMAAMVERERQLKQLSTMA